MGMFDNTFNVGDIPMEAATGYGNTNAFMIGAMQGTQGMVSGLGRLAGFQTEEDMLLEIYDNADFSTPEGRQAAVEAVMKINPTAGRELQKQLSEAAVAEAQTSDIQMRSDQQKVDWTKKLHASVYSKEFLRDATGDGLVASIHLYLERNGFEFNPAEIKTVAQANTLMAKQRKKEGDYSTYKSGLEGYVSSQLDRYIDKRAIQDSGVQTITVDSSTAASTSMDLPDRTTESPEKKFITEGEGFDENASQWESYWSGVGKQQALTRQLNSVTTKLIDWFQLEMFLPKDKLQEENMEDAIMTWIGGGQGPAFDYFLANSPEELVKFVNNPIAYYKKNIGKIEGTATYTGVDNTDLFANFDY
jgi:hypothetical protein